MDNMPPQRRSQKTKRMAETKSTILSYPLILNKDSRPKNHVKLLRKMIIDASWGLHPIFRASVEKDGIGHPVKGQVHLTEDHLLRVSDKNMVETTLVDFHVKHINWAHLRDTNIQTTSCSFVDALGTNQEDKLCDCYNPFDKSLLVIPGCRAVHWRVYVIVNASLVLKGTPGLNDPMSCILVFNSGETRSEEVAAKQSFYSWLNQKWQQHFPTHPQKNPFNECSMPCKFPSTTTQKDVTTCGYHSILNVHKVYNLYERNQSFTRATVEHICHHTSRQHAQSISTIEAMAQEVEQLETDTRQFIRNLSNSVRASKYTFDPNDKNSGDDDGEVLEVWEVPPKKALKRQRRG